MDYAIITGGGSGLGFAIGKALANKNINLILIGRNENKLKKAVEGIKSINPSIDCFSFTMDVTDEDAIHSLISFIADKDILIKYLINAAGVGIFGEATNISSDMIDDTLNSNLKGLVLMSSHLLPLLEFNKGKLVNIISTAGKIGKKNEALYCASKWGARGFTEALKAEYKGRPVKIIGVYPGGMQTEFWRHDTASHIDDSTFMSPDSVAAQICFSITKDAIYVSDITIDRP